MNNESIFFHFLEAVKCGNYHSVMKFHKHHKQLITKYINCTENGSNISAVSYAAASNGDLSIIQALCELFHVDICYFTDIYNTSPLARAVKNGHLHVVKYLYEYTRRKSIKSMYRTRNCDIMIENALYVASSCNQYEIVEYLIQNMNKGIKHTVKDCTPLHLAARQGHDRIVQLLLEKGKYNPNTQVYGNYTPLHDAVSNEHENVVKVLLNTKRINVNLTNVNRETAIIIACKKGNFNIVRLLAAKNNVDMNGTLLYSVENEDIFKYLVEHHHLDPREYHFQDYTPIILAIKKNIFTIVQYLGNKFGADYMNSPLDCKWLKPLSIACQEGNLQIVKYLVESVRVDLLLNETEDTPLMFACHRGHLHVVKYLLSLNKIFHVRQLEQSLLNTVKMGHHKITKLLFPIVSINCIGEKGNTPLHLASSLSNKRMIMLLLKNYSSVNQCNIDGDTALTLTFMSWIFSKKYYINDSQDIRYNQNIQCLLRNGKANPNLQNKNGMNALMLSVIVDCENLLRYMMLFLHGNVFLYEKNGKTVLDIAIEHKRYSMTRYLLCQCNASATGNVNDSYLKQLVDCHTQNRQSDKMKNIKKVLHIYVNRFSFFDIHLLYEILSFFLPYCNCFFRSKKNKKSI